MTVSQGTIQGTTPPPFNGYEQQPRLVTPGMAAEFNSEAIHQLDNLLIGEKRAKAAIIAGMVMGENVLYIGVPGGGKTTLAGDSYRLIAGLSQDDIGEIPPNADLTPQRLVGDEVKSSVTTTRGDVSEREDRVTEVDSILSSTTKVIYGNEINRTNPYVVNTLLEALENGMINTPSGSINMDDLLYSVLTMNPGEAHQSTFRVPHALASRIPIGAGVGKQDSVEEEAMLDEIHNGFVPTPEQVQPVTTRDQLMQMRRDYKGVPIPDHLKGRAKNMERATVDTLMQLNSPKIEESLGRVAKQHIQLSQALAFLGGEQVVNEEQLVEATRYMVTGRLGALSTSAYQQIPGVVEAIVQ